MRKLEVVYVRPEKSGRAPLDNRSNITQKCYSFLTAYEEVKCGQTIVGPNQNMLMLVINIVEDYPATYVTVGQQKIPLKLLVLNNPAITEAGIVWQAQVKSIPEQSEPRNLSISVAQAREWYACGNPVLRKLALTAYSEEELVLQFRTIVDTIEARAITEFVPNSESDKWEVLTELACIARYLNGQWKMKPGSTGYFIGKSFCQPDEGCEVRHPEVPRHTWILKHSTVMYPGLVYFKSLEAAIQAVQILGSRIGLLFK